MAIKMEALRLTVLRHWLWGMELFLTIRSSFLRHGIVHLSLGIGTAGPIGTSLWHYVHDSDEVVGTFFRTALALEEVMHGLDGQWRYIVMNQSIMAAGFTQTS
jgi:hypothetical protein